VSYPDVALGSISSWTLDFLSPKFYTAAILYTVNTSATSNDRVQGNSGFWGSIVPPPSRDITNSFIVRGSTVVQASTTVNIVGNCKTQKPREGSGTVQAYENDCVFDSQSVKIFTQEFVQNEFNTSFSYYLQQGITYTFAIQFTKGQYFKLTQQTLPFSVAFIVVWIVLFGIGNIGILQLLKGLFESALTIPGRIKKAPQRVSKVFSTDPRGSAEPKEPKESKESKESA